MTMITMVARSMSKVGRIMTHQTGPLAALFQIMRRTVPVAAEPGLRPRTESLLIGCVNVASPLADGGPIEAKRLDAVPWAAYCIRHHRLPEAASRPRPSSKL
jgi:hypothetical protein